MKKLNLFDGIVLLFASFIFLNSCNTSDDPARVAVKSYDLTVNWFRDNTTPDPTAFIDFYNGKAYTMKQVANVDTPPVNTIMLRAQYIDAFCFDRSSLIVSSQEVDFINMATFKLNSYPAYDTFNKVVGVIEPLSDYPASTFSRVDNVSLGDFNSIQYNDDINALFQAKALNGGYPDMGVFASDITNNTIVYQFKCGHNQKRGFFIIKSSNYLPGGTMTLSVKVEQ